MNKVRSQFRSDTSQVAEAPHCRPACTCVWLDAGQAPHGLRGNPHTGQLLLVRLSDHKSIYFFGRNHLEAFLSIIFTWTFGTDSPKWHCVVWVLSTAEEEDMRERGCKEIGKPDTAKGLTEAVRHGELLPPPPEVFTSLLPRSCLDQTHAWIRPMPTCWAGL